LKEVKRTGLVPADTEAQIPEEFEKEVECFSNS
jgi:hypothetical protein